MPKKFWNESFSAEEFVYGETPNEFIRETSSLFPEQAKIACFAEGEGRNAVYLATMGHDVTAYDVSPVGLEKTKQLALKNNVQVNTVEADLTQDHVGIEQYDGAVMIYGHVPKANQQFLIEQMIQSVKRGGIIIFEVYSVDQLDYQTGGPGSIEMLYEPKDILQWIEPHQCIHFYYGEAKRYEGVRHTGLGHVIQVILRKI